MKLQKRRKIFSLMVVLILMSANSIYLTKITWSTYDRRISQDGESLFYANNTPAYEDDIEWSTLICIFVSIGLLMVSIFAVLININEWVGCEEPYLFPPKFSHRVRLDNHDKSEE
jgi:hypothetical protein